MYYLLLNKHTAFREILFLNKFKKEKEKKGKGEEEECTR